VKRKIVNIIFLITGLALLLMLGTACTGTLGAEPLEEGEYPPLVERLAERFGLDKDEIMDFLEQLKDEKSLEMEERFQDRLDELVENGDITSSQEEAILEKKEELEAFKEYMEDMTVSEAREALKDLREDLKDWAEENDLELKYLFPRAAKRGERGGFFIFGFGCRR